MARTQAGPVMRPLGWGLGLVAVAALAAPALADAPAPPQPAGAAGAAGAVEVIGVRSPEAILTIRPRSSTATRQGLRQFVGISGANSGARSISINEVIIPPGGRAAPHRHLGSESAIYLLSGTVRTFYGRCLEKSVVNRSGDFLFIPANLPHMPVNLSAREPAIAIVARNDANEQEQVELLSALRPGAAAAPGRGCGPVPAR